MQGTLHEYMPRTSQTRPRRTALLTLACLFALLVAGAAQAGHDRPQPPRQPRSPSAHVYGSQVDQYQSHGGDTGRGDWSAQREYARGRKAGARAGWSAGYDDGRTMRPFCPISPECKPGASRAFVRGYSQAYTDSYPSGYRQGRIQCSPPRRKHRWW